MRDLTREELEEAVELVAISANRRGERRRVGLGGLLERAHLDLEPIAEALDPSEHANRVPFVEAGVEQVDVVPDPRVHPAARIDELEREVGGAALRPEPLLPGDGVDALDDPVLGQVGDRVHEL